MTVGVATMSEHQPAEVFALPNAVEIVRQALHRVPQQDRPKLWERIEALNTALFWRNDAFIQRVIQLSPTGPIRRCIAELVTQRREPPSTPIPEDDSSPTPLRRPLRRYKQLRALCCPTNAWVSTGVRWLSADPDMFWNINQDRFSHSPVGLQWRHRGSKRPVGLSRRWWLEDDGALCGEFWIPPDTLPQVVADLANERALAPSIGFRSHNTWTHLDPGDWNPDTGHVDQCRFLHHSDVEEVSMTDRPQMPTRVLAVL